MDVDETPVASSSAKRPRSPDPEDDDASMPVEPVLEDAEDSAPAVAADKPSKAAKGKGKSAAPKKPVKSAGEPGQTVLPAARVSRIIKADADVAMCGKEAVFLISKLTEHFVQKLADASYTNARLGKRKRVQYQDLANVVRSTDAFSFLQEIIPSSQPGVAAAAKSAGAKKGGGKKAKPKAAAPDGAATTDDYAPAHATTEDDAPVDPSDDDAPALPPDDGADDDDEELPADGEAMAVDV